MNGPVQSSLTRRQFLQTTGAAVLAVGVDLHGSVASASSTPGEFNAFITIDETGHVTVSIGQTEIGQGSSTGLSMIVADELGADWSKVGFEFKTGRPEYWHPIIYYQEQITGGSLSIVAFEAPMRTAAAAAREMLLQAAGTRLSVDPAELQISGGVITHGASGASLPMGEVVAAAAQLEPPAEPSLRGAFESQLVGNPMPRLDAPDKITGAAVFGVDVDLPDMVYAAVRQAPVFGQSLSIADASRAEAAPGVLMVTEIPRGIAVIGTSWWHANQALDEVEVTSEGDPAGLGNSEAILQKLRLAIDDPERKEVVARGAPVTDADTTLEAEYDVPFLAHATMEPMNATARWIDADHVEIWVPTQAPTLDKNTVSAATGIPAENVTIHMTFAGGGFGRRGMTEYTVQAAVLAQKAGRPVKVVWSREEDIAQDFHRPAFAARLRAHLKDGQLKGFEADLAGPGVWAFNRPPVVEYFKGVDLLAIEGLNDLGYAVENLHVRHAFVAPDRQIGYWRSIGYTHNTYFAETFVDEVFEALGQDPLAARKALLSEDPRSLAVLDRVAEISGWADRGTRHLGLAFFRSDRWQTRVAQVAEVVEDSGRLRVERVFVAADVGRAVNPLSVEAQLQGAVNFGLSAAMYGEITLKDGVVEQTNFPDYPLLQLYDAPAVEVAILQGGESPGSVGEVGVPCAAPALANAVFAATGRRIRSLPMSREGLF